ncbi:sialin-like isoform X2 [Biomphalaria pfeifferi]|uniref:Sialin-like isoform X2 n=1 Tax=Biomphalaria pfeifferi TaxID=112525 RepID=A0AAD8BJ64_BIOPF|nr:sialin-like isoform X2 [Biomphalaria pfeifferi]
MNNKVNCMDEEVTRPTGQWTELKTTDSFQRKKENQAEALSNNTDIPSKENEAVGPGKAPFFCSCRFGLSIISCLGFINLYALRVNMSVAMVCMINQTALALMKEDHSANVTKVNARPTTCDGTERSSNSSGSPLQEDGEFAWPKEVQGLILGSFFWGYLTTQVFGGWISQRFGGKHVFGWSMFVCAVVTLLMPVAARWSYIALIVTRIIAGTCQGFVWPAMAVLWARWAPPLERGILCSICYAGSQIGNVLTFPIAASLCEYGFDGGWPAVFYVLGGLGVVWFAAWMFFVFDSPDIHPRVSDREKVYIKESLVGNMSTSMEDKGSTPWVSILLSMKVWAIVVSHTCANWGTYTFLTNMPTYLREVLYFPVQANGAISALPYVGFFIVINVSGLIFDGVLSRNLISRTMARKIGNTLGLLMPGIFVLGVGYLDCSQASGAVTLLVIGVAMSGCQYGAGFLTNPADIAPRFAGVIFGLSNTFATLPGFIAPTVIGYITTNQTQDQWQVVFYIASAIYAFGAVFFIIFSSGEIQEWAKEKQDVANSDIASGKDNLGADIELNGVESGDSKSEKQGSRL